MSRISMDLDREKKLVKTAQKGGQEGRAAFEEIYKHYKPHLEKFYYARLGSNQVIEDLVAEVFKKALDGLDSFRWQGVSLSAWLYKISRNVLIDYFRKEDKRKFTNIKKIAPLQSKEESPESTAIKKEKYDILHEILNDLPEREQKIIYFKFFEGRRNKDIAKMMSLTETNVGTIVHRTVNELQKKLTEKYET